MLEEIKTRNDNWTATCLFTIRIQWFFIITCTEVRLNSFFFAYSSVNYYYTEAQYSNTVILYQIKYKVYRNCPLFQDHIQESPGFGIIFKVQAAAGH